MIRLRPACLTPKRVRVFGELQAYMPDPDASNSFWGIFVISRTLRRLCPVEMCELSELSELSPQDGVESPSVKGALGGAGLFFEEPQGLGRPISSGCSLFDHL